jgi:hypothetical protein
MLLIRTTVLGRNAAMTKVETATASDVANQASATNNTFAVLVGIRQNFRQQILNILIFVEWILSRECIAMYTGRQEANGNNECCV